jgi:hypothetical protein
MSRARHILGFCAVRPLSHEHYRERFAEIAMQIGAALGCALREHEERGDVSFTGEAFGMKVDA